MAKKPDKKKKEEIASMFSDYNFSRAKREGLWKKGRKSFKKFLTKLDREKQKEKSRKK